MWFLAAMLLGAVPFAGDAEAVAIGPEGAVLDSCFLGDIALTGVVGPSGEFWVTRNGTAWEDLGMRADLEAAIRLADDGGTITLSCPSGNSTLSWNQTVFGEIIRPTVGPRVEKVGQSQLPILNFTSEESWLFVWPKGRAVWEQIIAEAEERLVLHVYDLRSKWVVEALLASDADLSILVDNAIGLTEVGKQNRAWALDQLQAAGAEVVKAGSQRYRYHHLKVLVADDWVIVQSENASPSGMPASGDGNRGWGGAFRSHAMADWFSAWMQEDRAAWDSKPWIHQGGFPAHPFPSGTQQKTPDPLHITHPIRVRPLVSPDHTTGRIWSEVAASERIWTQQLQLGEWESNRQGWSQPDRFRTILESASDVRLHVSPHNEDKAEELGGTVVPRLHNKGIIMDDAVWFGSMNGNHASRAANREVSVWLEDPAAVAYFSQAFLRDEPKAPLPILLAVGFVAILLRRR